MALTTIDDRGLKTPIDLLDNEQIRFGTGNDLVVYHNGTHSYIHNTTGNLILYGGTGSSQGVVTQAAVGENSIIATANGSVELYYDNSKKLDTYSSGVTVYGNLAVNDNGLLAVGNNADLQIYHDGSNSYIKDDGTGAVILQTNKLQIQNTAAGEDLATFTQNGAVELYYDNSNKFYTHSTGGYCNGRLGASEEFYLYDNGKIMVGTGDDLQIYHDGSNSYVNNTTGNLIIKDTTGTIYLQSTRIDFESEDGEQIAHFISDGAVELYYNNVKTFETNNNGIEVRGPEGGDAIIRLSADERDDNADKWRMKAVEGSQQFKLEYVNTGANWETAFAADGDGAVRLYYDDVKRFETISTGVNVTGGIRLGGNNAANEMDDYEEGTFSPAINNAYSSITYASQSGLYVKIGRMVHCSIAIAMSSATAEGPGIRITGLPFTTHTNNYSSGGITYVSFNSSFVDADPYISGNTTEVRFYKKGAGTEITGASTNISSTKWLGVGITYQV